MAKRRTTTRSVTIVRSRSRRSYSRSGSSGVSLGIIAGLLPTALDMSSAVQRGEGAYGAVRFGLLDLTGYDILYKNFTFARLAKGWGPILLGALAHGFANRVGLNRLIRRYIGVPVGI